MICQYDYTVDEVSPNCDNGGFFVIPVEFEADPVTTSKCADGSMKLGNPQWIKCSGNPYNCVDGEGTLHLKSKQGRPLGMIYNSFNNLQAFDKTWEMGKLGGERRNIFLANYSRFCAGDRGTLSDQTLYDLDGFLKRNNYVAANMPDDVVSFFAGKYNIVARPYSSDPFVNANPFYEFECLDGADEVKARIRLIIRDWNVIFSKTADLAEIESPSPIAKIDFTGREPIVNNYYNDYASWDDHNISNGVPTGSYNDWANIDPDERPFYSINPGPARCEEDYPTQHFSFPGMYTGI